MPITHVLLVDDEVSFVETLSRRLTKRDLRIIAAHSGKEGLKKLEQHTAIEVVILDVKMPEMDGIEALRQIKSKFPLVEVIMLTGHGTIDSAIEGMKWGAFDYLLKPCDIDHLLGKVEEAAAQKRAHENKIVEARMKEIARRRP